MQKRGWAKALLIIIPYIIVLGIGQFTGALIAGANPMNMEARTGFQDMLITLFAMLFSSALVFLFVRLVDREDFLALGWRLKIPGITLLWASMLVIGAFLFGFALLLLSGQIQFIGFNLNWTELGSSFLLFLFVAITEELFVRGYILKNLSQSVDVKWALPLSSAFFAILHLLNPHMNVLAFVNLFLAGILLGLAYLLGRGLWLPVCIHFFWNFIQTHLGYAVSGQQTYSLIRISESEPSIWNGGEFGFEGSILAVAFQLAAISWMWIAYNRKQDELN